jgi:hypothetical protein
VVQRSSPREPAAEHLVQPNMRELEAIMNTFRAWFFVLGISCCAAQAADEVPLKKVVRARVEEINNALLKEDFAKVADLTHPKVIQLIGGREKMISVMESETKEMRSQGFALRSVKVDDPSDPVAAGSDLFVVVPFLLEMKALGGKLVLKSFVIGVSSDRGKSWAFVNGDLDIKKVKQVLPTLPDQLKLPEKQKPVFEKD